ncbi:MAG: hypothetical protein AB1638_13140 [Nitrospirota bacterium]
MAKSRLNPNLSAPKVLIGISVFLVLIGGMVIDPLTSFICFMLAGILVFIAALYRTRRLRYIAFVLLIIVIALAVSKVPEGSRHFKVYKERSQSNPVR